MKTGDVVTTISYGPNYKKMIGVVVGSFSDRTYNILWSNGSYEEYISASYIRGVS